MAERVVVVPRRERRERREEHRRHSHREHALREDVEAERRVDRTRRLVLVDQPRGEERVDECVEVDQPEADRDRHHQDERPADRGVAPVDHDVQPIVLATQPWQRQQQLDEGRDDDRDRVDVELRARRVRLRDADHEPDDDHRVPEDRREGGDRELVVTVEDPDHDPGQPEQDDDREQHA